MPKGPDKWERRPEPLREPAARPPSLGPAGKRHEDGDRGRRQRSDRRKTEPCPSQGAVREAVRAWRENKYAGATDTCRELLKPGEFADLLVLEVTSAML